MRGVLETARAQGFLFAGGDVEHQGVFARFNADPLIGAERQQRDFAPVQKDLQGSCPAANIAIPVDIEARLAGGRLEFFCLRIQRVGCLLGAGGAAGQSDASGQ